MVGRIFSRKTGAHFFPENALEPAGTVGACLQSRIDFADGSEHRRTHVAPSGNEGGKTSSVSTNDKEMDPVRALDHRNAAVRVALVPLREIAIVDLAVAVIA